MLACFNSAFTRFWDDNCSFCGERTGAPSLSDFHSAFCSAPSLALYFQSPAMVTMLMAVILPCGSRPNRMLAASPRGNKSFTR